MTRSGHCRDAYLNGFHMQHIEAVWQWIQYDGKTIKSKLHRWAYIQWMMIEDCAEQLVNCHITCTGWAKKTPFLACDCEAVTHAIVIDVCPSVCLSVKRVDCDKTKAPSKKSSIMTNRKSPVSFPMSLRWTSYVAPNPPKGAPKAQIWPIICNNFETVRDRM